MDIDSLADLFVDRVATAPELIHIGLSSNSIYARCRPGGPWQRLLPGVLLLANSTPTRTELARAAVRLTAPNSVLTGNDALKLHGLRAAQPGGPVHVLVPAGRQVRSDAAVRVERTTRMPKPVLRKKFLAAPVTRAVLDTARSLTSIDQARAVMAESVQRGLTTPNALASELADGSQRGSALPRKVLHELHQGVHSVAESWGYRVIAKSDLPMPEWNVRLLTADGALLGIADAWWDSVGLAWEIDSYEFHLSPADYSDTLTRNARMTGAGLVVVHTVPNRIRREPKSVLTELRNAYGHAAARSRPPVIARPR